MTTRSRRWSGFSLIELLVAIAVIALLATLAVIAHGRVQERARAVNARYRMTLLYTVIESERSENGRLYLIPELIPSLSEDNKFSRDPWGRPYLVGPFLTVARSPAAFVLEWLDPGPEHSISYLQLHALGEEPPVSGTLDIESLAGPVAFVGEDLPLDIPFVPVAGAATRIEVTLAGSPETGLVIFGGREATGLPARLPGYKPRGRNHYLIMSTGADRVPGGSGIDEDIIWRADYRDFQ